MILESLKESFIKNANPELALGMKNYMKNKYEFLGIPSPLRKSLLLPFYPLIKSNLNYPEIRILCLELFNFSEREFKYAALEILSKYTKKLEESDLQLISDWITQGSWWDIVDTVNTKLAGPYFLKFPKTKEIITKNWAISEDIWLRRSAIIFQLKYREKIDLDLLDYHIQKNLGTKEFFINKAIGWSLRELSKSNKEFVKTYLEKHNKNLHPLSIREASKYL